MRSGTDTDRRDTIDLRVSRHFAMSPDAGWGMHEMRPDETRRPRTWILPPAPYALSLLLGWLLDRNALPLAWDWGAFGRALAGLLIGLALALFVWTLWTFWRHHTTVNPFRGASALCTSGPFRLSRNPIYLGDWLLLVAGCLLLHTWWPVLFAPIVWAAVRFGVIGNEERHLEARFGQAYRDYKARVRRWV